MNIIYFFSILLFLYFPLFSQAGKLEKSAVRLKATLSSGNYQSDWEKRNQNFNLVYKRVWEENWQDQNKAIGGKLGVDYYASLKNEMFTHLLFGINFSDLSGNFPVLRYNESQLDRSKYKGGLRQTEFTFGTVIAITNEFRVIPKFVYRTINQSITSTTTTIISDSTDFAYLTGAETNKSQSTSGYLGLGLEYDITPNLSIYFDSLLFNNFLIHESGKYTISSRTTGYLQSGASAGLVNRYDNSEGSIRMSGNRFLLGGSLKMTDSLRFFIATERDTIYSEINSPLGTNALVLLLLSSRSLRASSDTINKTITENVIYGTKQKLESTTIQIGISKDLDI